MPITWPSNTKDIIDEIRDAIGRNITFNLVTVSGCSTCTFDPVNNASTDSFCPTCSGYWYITTTSGVEVLAHVRWSPFDDQNFQPGGIVYEGDCIATIAYDAYNAYLVSTAKDIFVNSRTMVIDKYTTKGVAAQNRIRLFLKELG